VVLIIAKRSIIPGEGSPLAFALISVVVVWLAKDSLRSMRPNPHCSQTTSAKTATTKKKSKREMSGIEF